MGYWIPEAGIIAFLKKYTYIIAIVVILAVAAGTISSYTGYLSIVGQYNVTAFEECGENLLECIETKNLTHIHLEECRSDLDRTLTLLEDLSPIQSELSICREDLSSLQEQLSSKIQKVDALLLNTSECEENFLACQEALNDCQDIKGNLTVCEANFTALKNKYDILVQNEAKEKCCINPNIVWYYYISDDNYIVCTSNHEEDPNTIKLSC